MGSMDTSREILIDYDGSLLRRVPNWPNMHIYDVKLGRLRPTSACFSDPETNDVEMSFSLEKPLLDSGGCCENLVSKLPGFGVASLNSDFARTKLSVVQEILGDPTDEDPYHCLLVGGKSKKDKKLMAKSSLMVVSPIAQS